MVLQNCCHSTRLKSCLVSHCTAMASAVSRECRKYGQHLSVAYTPTLMIHVNLISVWTQNLERRTPNTVLCGGVGRMGVTSHYMRQCFP
jgi:hypothetical protein